VAATIACDLLCWLRLLCLDGPMAKAQTSGTWVKIAVEVGQVLRLF
jgi:hypothetical protein